MIFSRARMTKRMLLLVFLFHTSIFSCTRCTTVGLIRNSSLTIYNSTVTWFNGSLSQCLCYMLSSSSISSMNYYPNASLCQMYLKSDQNNSFTLSIASTSHFYFLSLSLGQNDSTTSVPRVFVDLFWSFDSTFNDATNIFIGIPLNNVNFSSSSITGSGSSLSIIWGSQQGLSYSSPFLYLVNQSWTFEVWIRLSATSNSTDYAIVTQCQSSSPLLCLHLLIRRSKVFLGFYSNDLTGSATLAASTWYHVAFVFDCFTRGRQIYLNGFIDSSDVSNTCYQGADTNLTVGFWPNPYSSSFNGLIDHLSFTTRAKTADEILDDASLTFYYSFDNQTTNDQGSLQIDAVRVGATNFTSGRVGQALYISDTSTSYLRMQNLVLLGTLAHAYTISIWIKPHQIQKGAILHFSMESDGTGMWCLSLLGMSGSGTLYANSFYFSLVTMTGPTLATNRWTHVVMTYSAANGGLLYINGTVFASASPYTYVTPGTTNYLFVGSSLASFWCASQAWVGGQFDGAVDEFRLYSRVLSAAEVLNLANP